MTGSVTSSRRNWCAIGVLVVVILCNFRPSSLCEQQEQPRPKPSPTALKAEAWKLLNEMAASDKVSRRTDSLSAMASIDARPEVLQLVEAGLSDKDGDVRLVAVVALGGMKARTAIPQLKLALNDKEPEVGFAAAKALWDLEDHSGRDIFVAVLAGDRATKPGVIHGRISEAQRTLHNPMALALIGIKQGASAFLGPFSMGLSVAEAFAKDGSAPARALAASLLATDNSNESRKELEDALGDKNWVVRAAAARAIGRSGRASEIWKLAPLMSDDQEKDPVRCMAAASIVRLSRVDAAKGRAVAPSKKSL